MIIRNRCPAINFISWTIYGLIFLFLWILLPTIFSKFGRKPWYFSRVSSKLALKCFGIKVRLYSEKTPVGGGKVIIANHSSWLDQIILCAIIDCPLRFLANEKYFKTPLLSVAMKLYNHVPVRFKEGESGLTPIQRKEIISYIKAGGTLVAFPEATRSLDGSLLPFRKGIFKIAAEANSPIIPVQIFGAAEIFPKNAQLLSIKTGQISVKIGKEIRIQHQHLEEKFTEIEDQFRIAFQRHSNTSSGGATLA